MTFHELVTTYVVPCICGIIIWMTRQQNRKIEEVHVLVNQNMTDALAKVVLSMMQVAGIAKAMADQNPDNKVLAEQADFAAMRAKEALANAPVAVVEKVKEMPVTPPVEALQKTTGNK